MITGGRIGAVYSVLQGIRLSDEADDRPAAKMDERKIQRTSRRKQKRIKKVSGNNVPCYRPFSHWKGFFSNFERNSRSKVTFQYEMGFSYS